jgi:hypothetical protein
MKATRRRLIRWVMHDIDPVLLAMNMTPTTW